MVASKLTEEQKEEALSMYNRGLKFTSIAKHFKVHRSTIQRAIGKLANESDEHIDKIVEEAERNRSPVNTKVQTSTPTNSDFTGYEIDVLKSIVEERKRDIKLFSEYRVYEELSKVPIGVEQVRSAFNMSKDTTERLKKYANERRLPLQDLVELALINLLEKYDRS